MKGVPLRLEIGPRDVKNNQAVVVSRDNRSKTTLDNANLVPGIRQLLDDLTSRLQSNAQSFHTANVRTCTTKDELVAAIALGGFARIPFFSVGVDGEEGDSIVHELCGAEVRGSRPDEAAPPEGTLCLATGKPATCWAYAARSY